MKLACVALVTLLVALTCNAFRIPHYPVMRPESALPFTMSHAQAPIHQAPFQPIQDSFPMPPSFHPGMDITYKVHRETPVSHLVNGMTPMLTWYIPTSKCSANWYCRAEMTAYQEFQGGTVVKCGYSIWHFSGSSVSIPKGDLNRIAATTDAEINSYMENLAPAIYEDYRFQAKVCKVTYPEAIAAFKTAIKETVSTCAMTENYKCVRSQTAQKC